MTLLHLSSCSNLFHADAKPRIIHRQAGTSGRKAQTRTHIRKNLH